MKSIQWAICALLICIAQSTWAEKTAQAIWCSSDKTLYFINSETVYAAGQTYNEQTITSVWSGNQVTNTGTEAPDWNEIKSACTKVVFDASFADVRPLSCYEWFANFYYLTGIEGINYLNTRDVISMKDMFSNCKVLGSLDLSGFRTAKVTSMGGMFFNCKALQRLDLSSFKMSGVTYMNRMFEGCEWLNTIYVSLEGWSMGQISSSSDMFKGCIKLVGGNGTVYDSNNVNDTYAHIDGGSSNPGYFTSGLPTVMLRDNADNTEELNYFNGFKANVKLQGRTLFNDTKWNTLCLPFEYAYKNLNSPLTEATLMEMKDWDYSGQKTGFDPSDGTLYLYFTEVNKIEAGKPYIIKLPYSNGHITDPTFKDVTISSTQPATVTAQTTDLNAVQFIGTYSSTPLTAGDESNLFLGGDNMLYYPEAAMNVNACRAYFHVDLGGATNIKSFVLNFDGETTAVTTPFAPWRGDGGEAWYDLSGRKVLNGKWQNGKIPSGVYINNGRKVRSFKR